GNDHELGSVEPGKIADLVLLAGDPVERPEEIRNVVWVFKDGIAYDGAALVEATRGIMGIR
ncbi:MAG: amidohydrolase, partial [Gemmatimonadales bacterium]